MQSDQSLRWLHVPSTASGLSKEGWTRIHVILGRCTCWSVFAGHTGLIVGFVVHWFICFIFQVLEFLLWASMCMETSVPLLAVKYLSWRSTLYTAVCQCYFDCKASNHAEVYIARSTSTSEPLWIVTCQPKPRSFNNHFFDSTKCCFTICLTSLHLLV